MPAILFDLDDTLHDRTRGLLDFASDQFSRLGGSLRCREQFVRRFVQLDANGKVWKDTVYRTLLEEFDCVHAVDDLVTDYLAGYPRYAPEMPGATEALQALTAANMKIGIISNGRGDLQRAVIQALGFSDYVDAIVISSEVGSRKPQPDIFAITLDRLGVAAEDAVMVGDDDESDIRGALAVGIHPIGFRCLSAPPEVSVAHTMDEVVREALSVRKTSRS